MDIMKLYDRLPVCLQNAACSLEGVRVNHRKRGNHVQRELKAFLERKDWSYAQLCAYRDAQLAKMVEHCYRHVPYYHDLFDQLGVDYRSIRHLEDLQQLPILTKDVVRQNFDQLFADNVDKSQLMFRHTSGTTGSGFQFYYTKDAYAKQWAEAQRHYQSLGVSGKEWSAYFGGRAVVPKGCKKPPFYRINYGMKKIMLSAHHLSPDNYPSYIQGLERKKCLVWHGYPSSMLPIAQYLLDHDLHLSYVPKLIQLSSEAVTEAQLDKMEQAFGVRPLQGYALTEEVATFRQYRDGRMFVVEDLSAVELLPMDDQGTCRVIGTTLTNYGMPFLRYDTKDLVTWQETEEGRQILSIEGRVEDNIKLRDGGTLRRLSPIFKDMKHITESQIVQKSLDLLEFRIVRGAHYTQADEDLLHREIRAFLQDKIGYTVVYVDAIPKTKGGKMKFIVSEV